MKDILRKTIFYKLYKKSKAAFANAIYGSPSKNLFVVWVTGTDGKTTTVNLIHKVFNDNFGKTWLVSTVNIKAWEEELFNKTKMTSLDPLALQKILFDLKGKWCKSLILEVSSHGLDQQRFYGINFDMWVLTNITREHLDYHKNFEDYANTKKQLFKWISMNNKPQKYWVFPKDDAYGRQWLDEFVLDKEMDFGINISSSIKAENIVERPDGLSFDIKFLGNPYKVNSRLIWRFNVYNILTAISAGVLVGIPMNKIIKSIEKFEWLSWRMENVFFNWVNYYIDFAHTPNGLESVLKALNDIKWKGKITVVFGAPGERDPFKRPVMGEIADHLADTVIVTDDDPAGENRYDIIKQIVKWVKRQEWDNFFVLPEREFAIRMAVKLSKPWDIVLLAGKWHEKVQLTNFGKRPWNDKDVLLSILEDQDF